MAVLGSHPPHFLHHLPSTLGTGHRAAHRWATEVGCIGSKDVDGQTTGHGAENHPLCMQLASTQAQPRPGAGIRAVGARGGAAMGAFPESLEES